MIRQFKIINNIGQEYNLNNTNLFGYDPAGLGISFSNGYIATGTTFIPTIQTLNQNQISLSLLFGAIQENAYVTYHEFVDFLNYQPYRLIYSTDAGEYQRTCQLNNITKTEIKVGKAIDESMVLDCITPWYTYQEGTSDIDNTIVYDQSGDGKIYQLVSTVSRVTIDIMEDPNFTTLFTSSHTYWWFMYASMSSNYSKVSQQQDQGYQMVKYINQSNLQSMLGGYPTNFWMMYWPSLSSLPSEFGTMTFEIKFKVNTTGTIYVQPLRGANRAAQSLANCRFVECVVSDGRGSIVSNSQYGKEIRYDFTSSDINRWFTVKLTFPDNSNTRAMNLFIFEGSNSIKEVLITTPKLLVEEPEPELPPEPDPPPPVEPTDPPPPPYVPGQEYSTVRPHRTYDYIYEEENPVKIYNGFTIINNSKLFSQKVASPIMIVVSAQSGDVVNPNWQVYNGGELIASDGYNLTIPMGSSLIVSSFPDDQYAIMIDENYNRTDVYQNQDMTKTGFVTLAQGSNDINFNVGNGVVTYQMREEHLIV